MLVISLVVISFGACSFSPISSSSSLQDGKASSAVADPSNSALDFSSEISDHITDDPSMIQRELSSGVKINAEVHVPDSIDFSSLKTYQGTLQRLDIEKVKDAFLGEFSTIEKTQSETRESSFSDAMYTLYRTSDGYTLSSLESSLNFYSPQCPEVETFLRLEPSIEYNGDVFLKDQDLPFGSRDESLMKVQKVLSLLGVSVTDEPVCYVIDHETLTEEAERFQREQETGSPASYTNDQELLQDLSVPNYTENDDCYYFKFFASAGGFPITRVGNGVVESGSYMPGSTIAAICSKDGIVDFRCDSVYQETEVLQESSGLNLEEAISALDDKYNSIITNGTYEVQEIAFEYVPVSQGDGIHAELTPAWRFQIKQTVMVSGKSDGGGSSSIDLYDYVLINAVNGKEILKDVGSI